MPGIGQQNLKFRTQLNLWQYRLFNRSNLLGHKTDGLHLEARRKAQLGVGIESLMSVGVFHDSGLRRSWLILTPHSGDGCLDLFLEAVDQLAARRDKVSRPRFRQLWHSGWRGGGREISRFQIVSPDSGSSALPQLPAAQVESSNP